MSLRLLYLIFVRLCGWLILLGRSSVDDALHLAYRPFDDSWFGHLDADPHTDTAFDQIADASSGVPGHIDGGLFVPFDADGGRIEVAIAAEHALEVRAQPGYPQDQFLDPAWEQVDSARDDHVVGVRPATTGRAVMCKTAGRPWSTLALAAHAAARVGPSIDSFTEEQGWPR